MRRSRRNRAGTANVEAAEEAAEAVEIDAFASPAAEEEPARLLEPTPTVSSSSYAGEPEALPSEPAAEEISWQLEEADDTAGVAARSDRRRPGGRGVQPPRSAGG